MKTLQSSRLCYPALLLHAFTALGDVMSKRPEVRDPIPTVAFRHFKCFLNQYKYDCI